MDMQYETVPPSKQPWYAAGWLLVAAGVAAVLGLALLAVGVVAYTGASDDRDDADQLQAQAESVDQQAQDTRAQAEAAQEAAATLPDLVDEVDTQTYALPVAAGATVDAFNSLITCTNTVTDIPALQGCFASGVPAFEAAVEEEVAAVQSLGVAVADAQEALDAVEGGS